MSKARPQTFHEGRRPSGAPVSEGPALSTSDTAAPDAHASRVVVTPLVLYLAVSAFLFLEVVVARSILFGDVGSMAGTLSELAFVLALLGIVDVVFARWRPVAYAVTVSAISLVMLVVVVYASYAEQLPELSALRFAGEAWAVRSSVVALFLPSHLVFALGVVAPPLAAWRWRDTLVVTTERRHLSVALVALVALFVSVVLAGGAASATASEDNLATANSRGVLAYEVVSAASLGGQSETHDADFELTWSGPEGGSADSTRTAVQEKVEAILGRDDALRLATFAPGDYRGSNVIAIQLESMQQFPLGMYLGDLAVTPNLNALIDESWYFPNAFSQAGAGTTSDAEFVMNASVYAPGDEPASVAYAGKEFPALPRLLGKQGYNTFTMHANTVRFWNRSQLYPALGFKSYYDRAFFGLDDRVGMGMSDELMLEKAVPVIEKAAAKGPIYCQLITLSPHHPFNLPEDKVTLALPDWIDGTILGNYLQCMAYEDRCLGQLVNHLKADGLWDDTIVVIYGDHFGIRNNDLAYGGATGRYDMLLGHPYTYLDRANVPLLIHLPRQTEGKVVTEPVGQVDIMPTLADALGLDLSGVTHFGRSAFERSRPLVPLNRYVPAGSVVRSGLFFSAPVGSEDFTDGEAFSLATRRSTALRPGVEKDWRDAAMLVELSAEYAESLPTTGESKTPDNAILPRRRQK